MDVSISCSSRSKLYNYTGQVAQATINNLINYGLINVQSYMYSYVLQPYPSSCYIVST